MTQFRENRNPLGSRANVGGYEFYKRVPRFTRKAACYIHSLTAIKRYIKYFPYIFNTHDFLRKTKVESWKRDDTSRANVKNTSSTNYTLYEKPSIWTHYVSYRFRNVDDVSTEITGDFRPQHTDNTRWVIGGTYCQAILHYSTNPVIFRLNHATYVRDWRVRSARKNRIKLNER